MTTYCWKCKTCGEQWESESDYFVHGEWCPDAYVIRDYKAENAAIDRSSLK